MRKNSSRRQKRLEKNKQIHSTKLIPLRIHQSNSVRSIAILDLLLSNINLLTDSFSFSINVFDFTFIRRRFALRDFRIFISRVFSFGFLFLLFFAIQIVLRLQIGFRVLLLQFPSVFVSFV